MRPGDTERDNEMSSSRHLVSGVVLYAPLIANRTGRRGEAHARSRRPPQA